MYLQLKKTSWQHPRQNWKQMRETMLETGEEPHWKMGSEVLCTKRSNESWATKTSEKGGADVEGAGSKSADRLLNVRRVGGILKNLKSHGRTSQHARVGQQCKATAKCLQFFREKTLKRLRETQKNPGKRFHGRKRGINAEENTKTLQITAHPEAQAQETALHQAYYSNANPNRK